MEEPDSTKPRRSRLRTPAAVLLIVVVFGALLFAMWRMGVFAPAVSQPPAQSGAQVLAAVLSLLGVLATAAVTLISYLFKRSFDAHSIRLQETTEKRLALEDEQSRKRLDMETALKAVSLMTTQAGTESPPSQKSGALFALVTLDQLDLALALLDAIWPNEAVDSGTAVWLLERGLMSDSVRRQMEAGAILWKNRTRLYTGEGSLYWPECLYLDWKTDIDYTVRANALKTLLAVLVGKSRCWWAEGTLFGVLTLLQNVISLDQDLSLKAGAALAQNCLLQFVGADCGPDEYLQTKSGPVTFAELRRNLSSLGEREGIDVEKSVTHDMQQALKELERWARDEAVPAPPEVTPRQVGGAPPPTAAEPARS